MLRAVLPLLPLCLAGVSLAEVRQFEVKPSSFTITESFQAQVMPAGDTFPIRIDAEEWSEPEIIEILPHGTMVRNGDVLIRFDREPLDRRIEDAKRSVAVDTLALAQAEQDLEKAKATAPHRLDALNHAAAIAAEENQYFTKTRRKAAEREAEMSLARSREFLANEQEELTQLAKMYDADDLTEETEEIILTRQKNAVKHATFALEMEQLDHDRSLGVILPRQARELAEKERDTSIALQQGKSAIPRELEIKTNEVEGLRSALARKKDTLAKLEADLRWAEIKAPSAGCFYHGAIENGRWTTGDTIKSLVPRGRAPLHKVIATLIDTKKPLGLVAHLDQESSWKLRKGMKGAGTFKGQEHLAADLRIESVSDVPSTDGTYAITIAADWPKDLSPPTGATMETRWTVYQNDKAITIPLKALKPDADGWSVQVRLVDGKTESRQVQRGRANEDTVEIIRGLEAGQVVLVSEP